MLRMWSALQDFDFQEITVFNLKLEGSGSGERLKMTSYSALHVLQEINVKQIKLSCFLVMTYHVIDPIIITCIMRVKKEIFSLTSAPLTQPAFKKFTFIDSYRQEWSFIICGARTSARVLIEFPSMNRFEFEGILVY